MEQLRIKVVADKEGSQDWVKAHFLSYTLGDKNKTYSDVISNRKRLDVSAGATRPVWLNINIPETAKAGNYKWTIIAEAKGGLRKEFDLSCEVLNMVLPKPAEWNFHLDLWQNPFSVARIHNVGLWSDMHFELMRKYYTILADAGQKCATISLSNKPWNGQTYDPYYGMIKWIKKKDGSWNYDFSLFDKYVNFVTDCGIGSQINCYTMVPWSNNFIYYNETTGDYETLHSVPANRHILITGNHF